MKRSIFLSFFLISVGLFAAAPPPVPAPRVPRPIQASRYNQNFAPPRGMRGVPLPGGPNPLAGTPTHPVLQGTAVAQRAVAPPLPVATGNEPPPRGIRGIPLPGRGDQLVATPTNPIIEFNQQAAARRTRTVGSAAVSDRTGNYRQPPQVAAAPLPVAPIPARRTVVPTIPRNRIPQTIAGTRMLDIVNNTPGGLRLFIIDNRNQRHEQDLAAGAAITSVEIPNNAASVYVQGATPVPINNGLKGIVIAPQAHGIQNYIITPLVPTYDNYVLVYNESTIQQLVVLDIQIPSSGLMGWLPSALGGTHTFKISKQLEPNETGLVEIPDMTTHVDSHNTPTVLTPTSISLSVPSSEGEGPYAIDIPGHNSFVITAENNLVLSN